MESEASECNTEAKLMAEIGGECRRQIQDGNFKVNFGDIFWSMCLSHAFLVTFVDFD